LSSANRECKQHTVAGSQDGLKKKAIVKDNGQRGYIYYRTSVRTSLASGLSWPPSRGSGSVSP
jgi:hypothetical protein